MSDIVFSITGDKQLMKKLDVLQSGEQAKIVKKGLREGQKIILEAVRANAMNMIGGNMGSLISKKTKVVVRSRPSKKGLYRISVQPQKEVPEFVYESKDGNRSYIPSAIEYGHAAPGDARGPKVVEAIPYTRSAVDAKQGQALSKCMSTMKSMLEHV